MRGSARVGEFHAEQRLPPNIVRSLPLVQREQCPGGFRDDPCAIFGLADESKQREKPAQFAGASSCSLVRRPLRVLSPKQLINGSPSGVSERVDLVPRKRVANDAVIVQILILSDKSRKHSKGASESR